MRMRVKGVKEKKGTEDRGVYLIPSGVTGFSGMFKEGVTAYFCMCKWVYIDRTISSRKCSV